ncbi:MAG: nickel pincer cofactor biosynthesis protein LarC [Kiritimatiellia bacterium]
MTDILFLEGSSGISGDMTVAALLDLGGNREKLLGVLQSLPLDGYRIEISQKKPDGIMGCDFNVLLDDYGHAHHHGHDHGHAHIHRHLSDVHDIIDHGSMSEQARALAKRIFRIVAEAEAAAHGCSIEEVHFHEVGAVDSIVDIVSAAVLLDDLKIRECIVTGLTEGSGMVQCQHGELPVPVPAVLAIAQAYRIPLRVSGVQNELVTPTGIAIAAAIRTRTELPAEYLVTKTGIGLGKRSIGRPNLLRASLLEEVETGAEKRGDPERIWLLESNIDDSTGETLGFAMERLFAAGARDVHFLPCYMKKNRPAYLLRILCEASQIPEMERILFSETSTIGVRRMPVDRTCMARELVTLSLPCGGRVAAKLCSWRGIVRCHPEYESVRQIAEEKGLSFSAVFQQALQAAGAYHADH